MMYAQHLIIDVFDCYHPPSLLFSLFPVYAEHSTLRIHAYPVQSDNSPVHVLYLKDIFVLQFIREKKELCSSF